MQTPALNVLAIGGNHSEVQTLRSALSAHVPHARLTIAPDGPKGLALALGSNPDLILLDPLLPGADGLEACRKLKADPRLRDVPLLFLTSGETPLEIRRRALAAGAEGFLSRPLDETEVAAQILAMARIRGANRARKSGGDQLTAQAAGQDRKLAESERRLATLMSNLPGMAYRCRNDPRWTMDFVSAGCEPLTGHPPEDLLGNARVSFSDLIHPDDRQAVWDDVQASLRAREVFQLIYRIRTAQGEEKWVWEQGQGVMGEEEGILALEGFIIDITERKRAEEQLLRNEARLRGLVDILQHRSESTQAFLDHALNEAIELTESRIGYIYFYDEEAEEFVLNSWSRDVMKECTIADPQTCYALKETGIWGEAVRQRRPILLNDFEAGHPLQKGYPQGHAPLTRFLTVPVFKEDRIVAVVGVANKAEEYGEADVLQLTLLMDAVWKAVDIRRGEEALRESEEKYRLLAETTRDLILLHDMQGRILYINRAGLEFLRLEPQEVPGQSLYDLIPQEHMPSLALRRERRLAGDDASYSYETEFVNRAGERIPVEVDSTPVLRDGQVRDVLMVARDVTDRRRAAEEQTRLQAQLTQAQKMEAVGRLAGGVAHDFNNMLNVILGHTDLLLDDPGPGEALVAGLREIRTAARRSADLTRQLLAFARRQTIAPRVLDLNEAVESALRMLSRLIGEDIHLVWHPGEGLWPVRMDPSQIDQILANLCVNARDAIAGAGKVTIETTATVLDAAYCEEHPGSLPGGFVVLAVSDNGHGMDQETVGRLFEPFFTTKAMGKGTGLGLATVYGIVKQNNGFISVYSEPGQGTTFRIYFPRHDAGTEATSRTAPPTLPARGHETILVVEDEAAILELTRRMLERQGYTVLSASTPGHALHLAQEHGARIHLLLTDVVMPEMNGRELAKKLMALHPDMKRLFTSGYTANVIAHHGVLDEGVHFLPKPFSMADLTARVRATLDSE